MRHTNLAAHALLSLSLALALTTPALAGPASQLNGIVRSVLFYTPTCVHCHKVIEQDLPPLIRAYSPQAEIAYYPPAAEGNQGRMELALVFGGRLEILFVNAATPIGNSFYTAALDAFDVPEDRKGVPALFVGSRHLVGSREIPEKFPGIIEDGLASGGIPWPDIPGIEDVLASVSAPAETPAASATPGPTVEAWPGGMVARFLQDPAGNSVAVVALLGMIVSLGVVGVRLVRPPAPSTPARWKTWAIPLLAIAGIAVAGYLTYVEASGATAVCGPVGDCNAVQNSQYAYLFGVVPMGVVGLVGYLAILSAWAAAHRLSGRAADWASLVLFAFTAFGTVFSAILTFLEPFVIGATCIWCVTSAALMTALLWLAAGPGIAALGRVTGEAEEEAEPPDPE